MPSSDKKRVSSEHGAYRESKAAITRTTFSCEIRHFALFLSQIKKERRAIEKEKRQNADSLNLKVARVNAA